MPSGGGSSGTSSPLIIRNPSISGAAFGAFGAGGIGSGTPTDEIRDQEKIEYFRKIFDGANSFFGGVRLLTSNSYIKFKEIEGCYVKTHIKMKSPTSPLLRDAYTLTLKGVKRNGDQTILKEWDGTENILSATRRLDEKYNIVFGVRNDCGTGAATDIMIPLYAKYRIALKYQTEEEITRVDTATVSFCSREEECLAGQVCDGRRCYSEETGRTTRSYAFGNGNRNIYCSHETECAAGQLCDGHCYWVPRSSPVIHEENYLELDTPEAVLNF